MSTSFSSIEVGPLHSWIDKNKMARFTLNNLQNPSRCESERVLSAIE